MRRKTKPIRKEAENENGGSPAIIRNSSTSQTRGIYHLYREAFIRLYREHAKKKKTADREIQWQAWFDKLQTKQTLGTPQNPSIQQCTNNPGNAAQAEREILSKYGFNGTQVRTTLLKKTQETENRGGPAVREIMW